MTDDLSLKILESYVEIDKLHDEINDKMFNFITSASEFVDISEDDYQIEKTTELNKISLKGYVLDSPCCIALKNNNITSYSIDELKGYLEQYKNSTNEDVSKYYRALELYESIEKIEDLVDDKIKMEIKEISDFYPDINKTITIDNKDEYEKLYFECKQVFDGLAQENKINEKAYSVIIQIINDIFNYFISGYPTVPEEYLYQIDINTNE